MNSDKNGLLEGLSCMGNHKLFSDDFKSFDSFINQ